MGWRGRWDGEGDGREGETHLPHPLHIRHIRLTTKYTLRTDLQRYTRHLVRERAQLVHLRPTTTTISTLLPHM